MSPIRGVAGSGPRRTSAAVVRGAGHRAVVEELILAEPGAGEVVLRVGATGVCHTDLAMARGDLWPVYPVVLGHETAGTVEACGRGTTAFAPGDRVVMIDGACGQCAACVRGHPVLCTGFDQSERWLHLTDLSGEVVFQSTGGFAERLIVPEHSLIAVPDDIPLDVAAVASCSGITGVGAVLTVARMAAGDSVAVLGCGGVGLSAVMAAVIAGAAPIVAIDPQPDRRALALELGASDAIDPEQMDVAAYRGEGFAVVIEATGRPEVMSLAADLVGPGGCAVITGAPGPEATMAIGVLDLVRGQRRILGCLRGDARPQEDLDRIFELFRAGRLPLDRLITARIPLTGVPDALDGSIPAGLRTIIVPE
jgi:Zn-dependent alcohol dehydrogenase